MWCGTLSVVRHDYRAELGSMMQLSLSPAHACLSCQVKLCLHAFLFALQHPYALTWLIGPLFDVPTQFVQLLDRRVPQERQPAAHVHHPVDCHTRVQPHDTGKRSPADAQEACDAIGCCHGCNGAGWEVLGGVLYATCGPGHVTAVHVAATVAA